MSCLYKPLAFYRQPKWCTFQVACILFNNIPPLFYRPMCQCLSNSALQILQLYVMPKGNSSCDYYEIHILNTNKLRHHSYFNIILPSIQGKYSICIHSRRLLYLQAKGNSTSNQTKRLMSELCDIIGNVYLLFFPKYINLVINHGSYNWNLYIAAIFYLYEHSGPHNPRCILPSVISGRI